MGTSIFLSILLSGCIKKTVSNELQPTKAPSSNQSQNKDLATAPKGFVDRRLIDAEIKNHMKQISSCYAKNLKENPSLQGRLMVKFDIVNMYGMWIGDNVK